MAEILETVGDNDKFSDDKNSLPKPSEIKKIVLFPPIMAIKLTKIRTMKTTEI